jgi:hypothetical protein
MVLIADDSGFVKRIFVQGLPMSCPGGTTPEGRQAEKEPGYPPEPDAPRSGSHTFAYSRKAR